MSGLPAYTFHRTLAAVALVSALAACGSGGDSSTDANPSSAPNAAGAAAASAAADASAAPKDSIGEPQTEFDIATLKAINEARAVARACGSTSYAAVPPIRWNTKATDAALLESQFMQTNNFWGHVWPDGTTVADRLSRVGYNWQTAGENIAAGFSSLESVMKAWLDSPGHCANIMRADVDEVGVSLVAGGPSNTYSSYWTMVLAKQAPAAR